MRYQQLPRIVGDQRGSGKIRCEICHVPVREHRIGPCPLWDRTGSKEKAK